jgi:hypothetical protein
MRRIADFELPQDFVEQHGYDCSLNGSQAKFPTRRGVPASVTRI